MRRKIRGPAIQRAIHKIQSVTPAIFPNRSQSAAHKLPVKISHKTAGTPYFSTEEIDSQNPAFITISGKNSFHANISSGLTAARMSSAAK